MQEASISLLDRGQEFGSGVSRPEPKPQNELYQLGEMAEDTEPRTSVYFVCNRKKMVMPADSIYSQRVPPFLPHHFWVEWLHLRMMKG